MTRAMEMEVIINSMRTRKDGSLGFNCETPELTDEQKVSFMGLTNKILKTTFIPQGQNLKDLVEVKSEVRNKTQSQRIRAVLYKVWELKGEGTFEEFYIRQTERIIDILKEQLN